MYNVTPRAAHTSVLKPKDTLAGCNNERDTKDMGVLLKTRDAVLGLLEQARGAK